MLSVLFTKTESKAQLSGQANWEIHKIALKQAKTQGEFKYRVTLVKRHKKETLEFLILMKHQHIPDDSNPIISALRLTTGDILFVSYTGFCVKITSLWFVLTFLIHMTFYNKNKS